MDCDLEVVRGGEGILVERGMEPLGDIAGVGKGGMEPLGGYWWGKKNNYSTC